MIKLIKLNINGYTKMYDGGVSASIVGSYNEDQEVAEWLKIEGNEIEAFKTEAELLVEAMEIDKAEAQSYLQSTDYKDLPSYVPKDGENLEEVILKRNECRELIRSSK